MKRAAPFLSLALVALLAGCGSSSSSSSSPASSSSSAAAPARAAGGAVAVSESEFKITPADTNVSKAGTVTIAVKNGGKITHALAVQTPSGIVRTGAIAPGSSATLKVKLAKAGRYTFFCPIANHRQLGMQGMLVVGPAGGGTAPSTPTTTTSSGGRSSY